VSWSLERVVHVAFPMLTSWSGVRIWQWCAETPIGLHTLTLFLAVVTPCDAMSTVLPARATSIIPVHKRTRKLTYQGTVNLSGTRPVGTRGVPCGLVVMTQAFSPLISKSHLLWLKTGRVLQGKDSSITDRHGEGGALLTCQLETSTNWISSFMSVLLYRRAVTVQDIA
jgi:hypothetical protein